MRVLFQSYSGGQNVDNINSFGGLEVRFSVNWQQYLQENGHQTCSIHQSQVNQVADQIDFCLDAPTSESFPCPRVKHVHSYFHFDLKGLRFLDCYKMGRCVVSHPGQEVYDLGLTMPDQGDFTRVLSPIPYMDHWRGPAAPGFQRNEIAWFNKGNFALDFAEDHHFYYNGIRLLKALIKLNQRADFKVVFLLKHLINCRPEVVSLISQLRNVELLGPIPWQEYVARMNLAKINTHAGGLTSGIYESIFCESVPFVPQDFGFFYKESREVNLMPTARTATEQEIYEALEKLWFDEAHYNRTKQVFQDGFVAHRNPRPYWDKVVQTFGLEGK